MDLENRVAQLEAEVEQLIEAHNKSDLAIGKISDTVVKMFSVLEKLANQVKFKL